MRDGRAVAFATQNAMDLDYRALSNAGTWVIGRLQTDADRARVVEALVNPRWAMSYLRGPMTQAEIRRVRSHRAGRTAIHRDSCTCTSPRRCEPPRTAKAGAGQHAVLASIGVRIAVDDVYFDPAA